MCICTACFIESNVDHAGQRTISSSDSKACTNCTDPSLVLQACWFGDSMLARFTQSVQPKLQVNKLSWTCCGHIQLASAQVVSIIAGGHDKKACQLAGIELTTPTGRCT